MKRRNRPRMLKRKFYDHGKPKELPLTLSILFSRAKALEEEVNLVGNNLRSLQISEDQAVEREGGYEEKIRQLEQEYSMVKFNFECQFVYMEPKLFYQLLYFTCYLLGNWKSRSCWEKSEGTRGGDWWFGRFNFNCIFLRFNLLF